MLTLPIKKKWFDMICSGEKREEYRGITDYYGTRFREGESRPCHHPAEEGGT